MRTLYLTPIFNQPVLHLGDDNVSLYDAQSVGYYWSSSPLQAPGVRQIRDGSRKQRIGSRNYIIGSRNYIRRLEKCWLEKQDYARSDKRALGKANKRV
jgi:hypothetical protein